MDTSTRPPAGQAAVPSDPEPVTTVDVALGVFSAAVGGAAFLARSTASVVAPMTRLVLHPPGLPPRHHPGRWVEGAARAGVEQRQSALRRLSRLLDVLVPAILGEILARVDLTETVAAHVDLDALVAQVDLDAAAARLDVDAVARRLDLDAVLDRLDLTSLVRERVDLNALVAAVDLNAVAGRLDVDAVARRLDLDAVIERIDLVGLAEGVIEAIDLPEIIRESTGTVASETVRGVRMQSIAGDEALGRVVDRLLRRRGGTPETIDPDTVAAQREPGPTSSRS